jgi:hypothetical protein
MSPKLPVELLVTIAEFLLGDSCSGTVANLNVTCRIVHQETASALYHTVFLPWNWATWYKINGVLQRPAPPLIPYPEYVK